jgi:ATP-dependent Clp protease ATP-binding subunit ClpA
VVVLAQEESRLLKHNYIGTEHILLGLVRENEGVAARILLDCDADAETIRNEVMRTLGSDAIGSAAVVAVGGDGVGSAWFGGLSPVLQALQTDIDQDLDRAPDSGDLLLALASAPTTRAAVALQAEGVDLDALTREVDRGRQSSGPSAAELTRALGRAVRARHAAAAAQEYEAAAELRDEEKRLRAALKATERIDPTTVAEIRARLGLAPLADPPA